MIVSSARPQRRLVFAAFALCLAAEPALAQATGEPVGEPLRLGPVEPSAATEDGGDGGETDTPDGDGGRSGNAGAFGDSEEALPGEGAEGIEVNRLGELATAAIGILDPGNGGFPADMWKGTPRSVAESLIPRMPADIRTPALRELSRRLLLSSAAAPVRRQAGENPPGNLLILRAERLAALGETDGLIELLRVVPQRFNDAAIARLRVEALFLAHQPAQACQIVRETIAENEAPFWQKALAVCQIHAGRPDQASLTVSLLREMNSDNDKAFFEAFAAVERGAEEGPALSSPAPLHLALLFAGGQSIPEESLSELGAAGLQAVAAHAGSTPEVRVRAAELAAARGVLAPARLRPLYGLFDFAETRLRNAASLNGPTADGEMTPVRRRALLYQAARSDPAAAVRAELVREVLASTRDRDDESLYLPLARLLAPIIASIEAKPELAWFAETAGRALYAAGRGEAANKWLVMARQEAIINPEAAAAVTMLWPYARLSGAGEVPLNDGLAAWRSARNDQERSLSTRESLLQSAFQALGAAQSRAWVEIAADGFGDARPAPPAAVLFALREAGEAGRLAEAVLLSVIVLGETGMAECHPVALEMALTALSQVGLKAQARRLAIEAAVASGI